MPSFDLVGPPMRGKCSECGVDLDALVAEGKVGHLCTGERTAEIVGFAEHFARGDVPPNWIAAAPCTLDGALRTVAKLHAALDEALDKAHWWASAAPVPQHQKQRDLDRIAELRARFVKS